MEIEINKNFNKSKCKSPIHQVIKLVIWIYIIVTNYLIKSMGPSNEYMRILDVSSLLYNITKNYYFHIWRYLDLVNRVSKEIQRKS